MESKISEHVFLHVGQVAHGIDFSQVSQVLQVGHVGHV